jgi:hypothetical protein
VLGEGEKAIMALKCRTSEEVSGWLAEIQSPDSVEDKMGKADWSKAWKEWKMRK